MTEFFADVDTDPDADADADEDAAATPECFVEDAAASALFAARIP